MTIRSMYVYNGTGWDEVGFTVAHDVPAGGATGTLLSKASATDYDTSWLAQSALTIAPSQVTGTALVATNNLSDVTAATARTNISAAELNQSPHRWAPITTGKWIDAGYGQVATSAAYAAGEAVITPIIIPATMTIDRFAIQVQTAAASSTVIACMYNADATTLQPTTLQFQTSAFDSSTTGLKSETVSQTVTAGVHWVGILVLGGTPSVRWTNTSHPLCFGSGALSSNFNGYIAGGLSSLPSTWTSTTGAAIGPRVIMRSA